MGLLVLKKRILILGDSLCLPRTQPSFVEQNQTWPYLLMKTDKFEITQLAIGGGTLKNLKEQSAYYEAIKPDILIIQSGIVDCAPRALGRIENEIINSNHLIASLIFRVLPIKLMRKYRKITYTKQSDFKKMIKELISRFSNSKIIWIGILPASIEYEKLLPGISKNITTYNNIIVKETENIQSFFLDVNQMPKKGIMSDHHHLNSIGQKWLFDEITRLFSINNI